jgi:hypothetical protein
MDHFDQNIDWQEYDAPHSAQGDDAGSRSRGSWSSYSRGSSRSQSITGPYLPAWRRGGSQDGIAMSEGKAARVTARGDPKILGALPGDKGAFKKIQRVPYSLTKKQTEYMTTNFPHTFFQVTKDHNHDHPVAHLETMIACRHLADGIRDGAKCLDINGNPGSADTFMARNDLRGRSMEALCSVFTEKDELRAATKWGDPVALDGRVRYREMLPVDLLRGNEIDATKEFDVFLFIHTLYYVDFEFLASLLALRPRKSVYKAVIHRHKDEKGRMFGGEIEYVKKHGFVVQTNVETGERYTHRDMEWMFTSRSKVWRSATGAITWTFKKVTEETWIIEGASCPNNLDERFRAYEHQFGAEEAAMRMNEEDLLPSNADGKFLPEIAGAKTENIGGIIVVTPEETKVPIPIKHFAFFEYLATSMVGKPRDEERLRDLYALARRENAVTSTFPGAKKFNVPHYDVADHVHLAFHAGCKRETMLLSAFAATAAERRQHDRLANGASLNIGSAHGVVGTALKAARVVNNSMRAKNTFGAILDEVDSFR